MNLNMNLTLAGFDTLKLAKEFGLPLHLYDARQISDNLQAFQKVFSETGLDGTVCYAVKACGFAEIIKIAAQTGAGADVASEYELGMALKAGIPPNKVTIHGNAKSDVYLEQAVATKALIAANHHTELDRIEAEAKKQRKTARILIRLSGFDLDPVTAAGIFTAGVWCKFGEPVSSLPQLLKSFSRWPHLEIVGFHVHIGSQITALEAYQKVLGTLAELALGYQRQSGKPLAVLNLGGGFPVSYVGQRVWKNLLKGIQGQSLRSHSRPIPLPTRERKKKTDDFFAWEGTTGGFKADLRTGKIDMRPWRGERFYSPYSKEKMLAGLLDGKIGFQGKEQPVKKVLARIGKPKLIVEPGRAIVGDGGITLAKVMDVYEIAGRHPLVTLDLGIVNHGTGLVEPDLYPWTLANDTDRKDRRPFKAFVAGRLCFSGDMLSRYVVSFPRKPVRGDIAVIEKTGAYAPTFFASQANAFPLPNHVLIKGKQRHLLNPTRGQIYF